MLQKNLKYLMICMSLLWVGVPTGADIFNGSFELSDPVNNLGVKPPTGWKSNNYTNIISHLDMSYINTDAHNWDPNIVANGLDPYDGDYLVLLSTGDVRLPDMGEVAMAKLTQKITVQAGSRISGVYFFGACDYLPYDDYAEISLVADPNSTADPNVISLAQVSISSPGIGNHGSTAGWVYFEHVFSQQQEGEYDLIIGVYDVKDFIWNSYLAVDALMLCENPKESDINGDCNVDLMDYNLLASDWLKSCSDPNESCHPNTNLAGNQVIDMHDLDTFLDDWFWVFSEQ